jgi:type I restriction enzyme S subunit
MKTVDFSYAVDFLEGPGVRNWQFTDSGVKLINIRNLVNDNINLGNTTNHLSEEEVSKKYSHFLLEEGDYVMASSGVTWGKIAEVKKEHLPLCLNTSIIKLKTKNKDLVKEFLWYFIKSQAFTKQIDRIITGSAQPNFGPSHLKKIKIPLPTLPQQQKIVDILDAANALRQNDKALIAKYDELTQALFLDMFGDPVSNPKGWEKVELKKCTSKIGSGSTPRGGKETYLEEGTALIRSLNIYDNVFKYKNLAFISDEQADKLKNVIVESNDVLFNITGASVCRCSIVPDGVLPARVNQHVSILRPIKEKLSSSFLSHLLISENVKIKLLGVGSYGGAVMEAITKEQLEKFEIIIPSITLQNQFAERVALIEEQKAIAQASLIKSEELFNSLLQKAFKGELA